jgi:hypothetical protein
MTPSFSAALLQQSSIAMKVKYCLSCSGKTTRQIRFACEMRRAGDHVNLLDRLEL